jgi:hypothetical protein
MAAYNSCIKSALTRNGHGNAAMDRHRSTPHATQVEHLRLVEVAREQNRVLWVLEAKVEEHEQEHVGAEKPQVFMIGHEVEKTL